MLAYFMESIANKPFSIFTFTTWHQSAKACDRSINVCPALINEALLLLLVIYTSLIQFPKIHTLK